MEELIFLNDLLVIFGLSIVVVFFFHKLRLPPIIGFLIAGVLLGPKGLSLIGETERVEALAQLGLILLLFAIGIEFSLATLARIKGVATGVGVVRVLSTIFATVAIGAALGWPFRLALFTGFLASMSSTAVVMRLLTERGEIDSAHGRITLGVTIFEDLLLVPMMLAVPLMAGEQPVDLLSALIVLVKAALVIAAVLFGARIVVPKVLEQIVGTRSRDVFIISIILICLGTAWLTWRAGLSLAIGAFLAGLIISESEYSHQALSDILPVRDSLSSLFFISVGMLIDPGYVLASPLSVLAITAAVLFGKGLITAGAVLAFGYPLRIAGLVAGALAQVGEFSFVLLRFGLEHRIVGERFYQLFLSASVATMALTPLLVSLAPRAAVLSGRLRWLERRGLEWRLADEAPRPEGLSGHVIIAGYGLNGRNLARLLKQTGIPYIVLELNGETVLRARQAGEPIYYGDAASREVLKRLGIERARAFVLAIADPVTSRRAVRLARELNPSLYILVRTRYVKELEELYRLGANEVIPEEFETAIEMAARVLREYQLPRNIISQQIEQVRRERYEMFRELYLPSSRMKEVPQALSRLEIETFTLPSSSPAAGRSIREIDLRNKTGTTIFAVLRDGQITPNPSPDFQLSAGDSLILLGERRQIDAALELLGG